MKPYYQDLHNTLYNQDFRKNDLSDESVQCVVTSPPYWGLRKYSGEQELIWGDNHCEHNFNQPTMAIQGNNSMVRGKDEVDSGNFAIPKFKDTNMRQHKEVVGNFCSLCGAWKGAYGLEPTPEMYVQHTIEILREIRRVLRKDGVVFWNIGDSYNSKEPSNGRTFRRDKAEVMPGITRGKRIPRGSGRWGGGNNAAPSLKPKDLCLIPFRVAIAAQEDGWWVRSVIIWSKPNPMPESVTDRPTESHEYILMLTKSAKYYWDADAVREENTNPLRTNFVSGARTHGTNEDRNDNDLGERSKDFVANGRNIRSVWEFPTQPYPEAHFAVFPEKLPETCIKAATPEVGCCSKCGAPWERIIDRGELIQTGHTSSNNPPKLQRGQEESGSWVKWKTMPSGMAYENKTLGWQPTCKCNADKVPSIVLDPFAGAGTTLWVAKKLNRKAVGYEISEEYCQLALERNRQQVLI